MKDGRVHKLLIRKYGKCFNCVKKGHCARDCKMNVTCKNFKGNHHTCLCDVEPQQRSVGASGQSTSGNTKIDYQPQGR